MTVVLNFGSFVIRSDTFYLLLGYILSTRCLVTTSVPGFRYQVIPVLYSEIALRS